ncbi:MAG TPA: alpha/beta hydrolase, partial [Longimicrobium sp.]
MGVALRAARIGAALFRIVVALIALLLLVLVGLRIAAGLREGAVAAPAGTVRFATPTGAVAARVAGPADGAPLVIVHGTAAWSGFWKDVAAHLAGKGWRVVAIDLPPFGWSDRDARGRYDRIAQAQRLASVLTALGRPAVVVGHSFGAGPATELALRHPQEVRALVLVDGALGELDPKGRGAAARVLDVRPAAELVTSAAVTNPAALRPLLRSMIARKDKADAWLPVLREPMGREGATSAYAAWLPNLFVKDDGALSRRSA